MSLYKRGIESKKGVLYLVQYYTDGATYRFFGISFSVLMFLRLTRARRQYYIFLLRPSGLFQQVNTLLVEAYRIWDNSTSGVLGPKQTRIAHHNTSPTALF